MQLWRQSVASDGTWNTRLMLANANCCWGCGTSKNILLIGTENRKSSLLCDPWVSSQQAQEIASGIFGLVIGVNDAVVACDSQPVLHSFFDQNSFHFGAGIHLGLLQNSGNEV